MEISVPRQPNYGFDKRRKELERKRKQEEKRQRKDDAKQRDETAEPVAPPDDGTAELPPDQ
jgi:hypothetical protein